jgi:RNA polymerase primary sigma factor
VFPVPPLPRLRIAALDDLARQLRFAPGETLRRQIERTRALAAEIEAGKNYPEDWIIYRITGYRPQMESPAMLVGEALLADISALVERLSAAAGMREAELDPAAFLDAAAVCERWKISRKTLDRYRRMGLVALRVSGAAGKPKLVFGRGVVERFELRHAARLAEAGAFARMGAGIEARMVLRARRYARAGLSLNQAAARIARRYDRGHETVRQLLQRSAAEIFQERGPPTERERRLIERAYWLWIDAAAVARHVGRSRASIQRIITDTRAARLRRLGILREASGGRGERGQGWIEEALAAPAARRELGGTGHTDLLELIAQARAMPAAPAADERARALAYRALLARAGLAIEGLPGHGAQATIVDRIETDLRWAARLKAELVRWQLGQLVRTLESSLGRALEELRTSVLCGLVQEGLAALGEAVDMFDPRKGGRLAAPAGLGLNRVAARFGREHGVELSVGRSRAMPRTVGHVRIADWTRAVAPWQQREGRAWLEPDVRLRAGLKLLDESERRLLIDRFGWDGPPLTHVELARRLETTTMRTAQLERRAARRAIAAAGAL